MMQSKVVLCGYMGSGKSVVGRMLAESLNIPHLDLDDYIAAQEGMEVAEIIRKKGEIYFRKSEYQYFNELMNEANSFVLSLGGGTPVYSGNHLRLKEPGVRSVYLRASIPELIGRLKNEKQQRPLLDGLTGTELEEYIGKHLLERQPFYFAAEHVVPVDGKSVAEVVSEIKSLLLLQR